MEKNWTLEEVESQRQLCITAIASGDWDEATERHKAEIRYRQTAQLRMLEELEKGDIWSAAEYCFRLALLP